MATRQDLKDVTYHKGTKRLRLTLHDNDERLTHVSMSHREAMAIFEEIVSIAQKLNEDGAPGLSAVHDVFVGKRNRLWE